MEIVCRERDFIAILDIQGEIGLYSAPEIKDKIQGFISENKCNVIINLGEVSYIDSSGIGALISSLSSLKKSNGGMKIINVLSTVRKVFELTKLVSFFEIYDSEDEAIAKFKEEVLKYDENEKKY